MSRRVVLAALLSAGALILAGCAASSDDSAGSGSTSMPPVSGGPSTAAACSPSTLETRTAGVLTVGTDSPAYAPWFVDDKPSNGKGYESAVAFAVAKQLGYPADKVKWIVASFNSIIAPTPKAFDVAVDQVSITALRAKAVDFSSGYYDDVQAVVALTSDKYADATSIAGLHGAKLAAQQGSTSFDAINDVIKPGTTPAEYASNDDAVQALDNGQVDGLVVDLPTAFYVTSAQVEGAKIVGQLPAGSHPEQFGMVLDLGSSLTPCVSKAVDALRANGTLAALKKKWLTTAGNAPELK